MPQKIVLNVDYSPRSHPTFLINPPTKYSIKPGATATLECPGIANPVPTAVWSRPDGVISNNRTTILSYGLQIFDVKPEDRGTYVCRLDNGISPVLVHTINLEVQEPPVILRGPTDSLTDEGNSLELDCSAHGYPKPTIYWLINGADTRWDNAIQANQSALFIKSIEKKHAGIVQCFAKNEVGEACESNLLQVNPKQIPGEVGIPPLGTFPHSTKSNFDHTGKPPKGRKKHKHSKFLKITKYIFYI